MLSAKKSIDVRSGEDFGKKERLFPLIYGPHIFKLKPTMAGWPPEQPKTTFNDNEAAERLIEIGGRQVAGAF